MAAGVHFGTQIQTEDVVYDTLPLYHSAGGTSCLGQSIVFGCTLVLRKKFSASGFWVEACRHQCTVSSPSQNDSTLINSFEINWKMLAT